MDRIALIFASETNRIIETTSTQSQCAKVNFVLDSNARAAVQNLFTPVYVLIHGINSWRILASGSVSYFAAFRRIFHKLEQLASATGHQKEPRD